VKELTPVAEVFSAGRGRKAGPWSPGRGRKAGSWSPGRGRKASVWEMLMIAGFVS